MALVSKAAVLDNIPARFLKDGKDILTPILTYIDSQNHVFPVDFLNCTYIKKEQ